MKKTVKLLTLLQLLLIVSFSSCKKDDALLTENNAEQTENQIDNQNEIVLGSKLENAYSVENMKKAYRSLKEQDNLKSISNEKIEIKATHLYVRFLPKDSTDINTLFQDTTLELFDYPLDYEIEKDGLYYHDPNIPKGQPTWQYTVVPVDYQFTSVEHEILEECFIPDEDSENTKLKSSGYSKLLAFIEFESMKLTDNLTNEEKEKSRLKGWWRRWFPSKVEPRGTIQVNNTVSGLEGVMGVKVRAHRIVKIKSTYTDRNGNYHIKMGFRYNVHYALLFKNATGFAIWGNRAFVAPARYNMGWHSKNGYDFNIHTNSKAWLWATVNNGTYIYREDLCPRFNINRPSSTLRLWTIRIGGEFTGSAPMSRQISMRASSFKDFALGLGVSVGTIGVHTILPDIFIIEDFTDTRDAYSTIFHELAHASHYSKAGKWYWLKYVQGIINNGGDYGDGTARNDGYIGVGEIWGNYFGFICENDYFGWAGFDYDENWFNPGILREIDDDVGLSPNDIFNCLTSDARSHDKLKNKLISRYGHSMQINQIFEDYGF